MGTNILEKLNGIEVAQDIIRSRKAKTLQVQGARKAGVLLIIYGRRNKKILFIKRSNKVRYHQGEISLPGGAFDSRDSTLVDTAIRETSEEIGLSIEPSAIWGQLDDVPTHVSNFVITPFVTHLDRLPPLRVNLDETVDVIGTPLRALLGVHSRRPAGFQGLRKEAGFFRVGEDIVWGATGSIVKQFLDIITPNAS